MNVTDLQSEIDLFALSDNERDVCATVGLKAGLRCGDFVVAYGERGGVESSGLIGDESAASTGLEVDDRYLGACDSSAGRIGHRAPERDFTLCESGAGADSYNHDQKKEKKEKLS
jgi:hypothetical protein